MRIQLLIATIAALFLAGCDVDEIVELAVPEDANERVDRGRDAVLQRDFEGLRSVTAAAATDEQITTLIEVVDSVLPQEEPDQVRLAGFNSRVLTTASSGRSATLSLTYTLDYSGDLYRLDMRFEQIGESPWYLTWIHTAEAELHTPMSFDMTDLQVGQSLAIVGLFAVPGFILLTFIASFFFRRIKRRILWSLFMLAGTYPVFSFNWTTQTWTMISPMINTTDGAAHFELFSFKLLGAGFENYTPLQPAIIELAIPIGALLFWYRVMRGGPTRKAVTERRL